MASFIFCTFTLSIFLLLGLTEVSLDGLPTFLTGDSELLAFFNLSRMPVLDGESEDAFFLGLPLPFLTGSGSVLISNLLGVAIRVFFWLSFINGFFMPNNDLILSTFLSLDLNGVGLNPRPRLSFF